MKNVYIALLLTGCTDGKFQYVEDTAEEEEELVPWWTDISDDIEAIRADNDLPALGGAHIQEGTVTFLGTSGLRSVDSDVEVTDWDKWHLGSCTKAMTATLVGTYVDEGLLTWETTLLELFPDVDMHGDYETVTVAMLLSHYGGTWSSLTSHSSTWAMMREDGEVMEQRQQIVEDVLTDSPEVTPGSDFVYSNAGYIIVGAALEELTETSWEEMMQERIFDPLDMNSCGFGAQDPDASLQHPWGHSQDGEALNPVTSFGDNPKSLGPAGTVHCNLPDWGNFIIESLNMYRGEPTLVSAEQAEQIFTVRGANYSLGWGIYDRTWAGGKVFTHSGSNTMNRAVVWAAPELNEAYLAVTNISNDVASGALDDVVVGMLP